MNPILLLKEKWNPPPQRTESFRGHTVLITGANTGLGLEAAKKIAALEADRLIVTTRTVEKGEVTKRLIDTWLAESKSPRTTEIIPMVLDMTTSTGVRQFLGELSRIADGLDDVILNAGVMSQYKLNTEAFEYTLAINTINTIYLTTLLTPILIETAKVKQATSHMTIVSSRNALLPIALPTQDSIIQSSQPLRELSKQENFPGGALGAFPQYNRSKLLLEYALRRFSQSPELYNEKKQPYVIVNSVCPGATKSDLGRVFDSWWTRILALLFGLLQKSTADGANSYLTAVSQGPESMGQLWEGHRIIPEWDNLTTARGQQLGDHVWEELQTLMREWDASL